MAKSSAERVRAYRERKRAEVEASRGKFFAPPSYLKRSFSKWLGDQTFVSDEALDSLGVSIEGTWLNSEIQTFPSQFERDEPITALQRAVALAEVFADAAAELSAFVNAYKLEEIERAINEAVVASANLPRGDVDALKSSFAEIERLKEIRSNLRKPSRLTLPAIRAEGE